MLITDIEISQTSGQEKLPLFSSEFPYIRTHVEMSKFRDRIVPWHWHGAFELFYMAQGELQYSTPGGNCLLRAGEAGLVNSGVLHKTQPDLKTGEVVQLLHLFDPFFLCDSPGGRMAQKFVFPVLGSGMEMITVSGRSEEETLLLGKIRDSFQLDETAPFYEITLRAVLSDIWSGILRLYPDLLEGKPRRGKDDGLKKMMIYVHDHFHERILSSDLAKAAYISERECYRLFRDRLHCSPGEYVQNCRLQAACEMLRNSEESIANVAEACGFGNSSHFGRVFLEMFECTPGTYRENWQKQNRIRQE